LDLTGYKLTFSDEFNSRSISYTGDGTTWQSARDDWRMADGKSEVGFGVSSFLDPSSGYDPFNVSGGALTITAQPDKTPYGYQGSWESGLITTQGNFSQQYGYFEMRADMSNSPGAWDAFWLMPDRNPNPDGDSDWTELDIVEHYGAYNQGTYRWIHTNEQEKHPNPNETLQVFSDNPEQTSGYHTYGVNWTPTSLDFYFDGQFMGSKPTPSDFHDPMYIIANLAVNGDVQAGATSLDPMKIDYIRAYSNAPNAVAVKQDAVSAPDGRDPGLYGATTAAAPLLPTTPTPSDPVVTNPAPSPELTAPSTPLPTVPSTPSTPPAPLIPEHVGQAYRLYDLFDREPDIGGLSSWVKALDEGVKLTDVARGFLLSDEFTHNFGALNTLSNEAYVNVLYENVLERSADWGGFDGWVNALNQGASREAALIGFTESSENQAQVAPQLASVSLLDWSMLI
jgi:beta-glucanase (GH16 family)